MLPIHHIPRAALRFNALIWSPLTAELKRQLCYDQRDTSTLCTGTPASQPTNKQTM